MKFILRMAVSFIVFKLNFFMQTVTKLKFLCKLSPVMPHPVKELTIYSLCSSLDGKLVKEVGHLLKSCFKDRQAACGFLCLLSVIFKESRMRKNTPPANLN